MQVAGRGWLYKVRVLPVSMSICCKMLGFIPVLLCSVFFTGSLSHKNTPDHPHIIYILADDLGWNDVSFHGSDQIPTPNIDALAYNGVILNRHYTQPVCTPSRASLLTGKYTIHTGIHGALLPTNKAGLGLSEKIMPQYFKEMGYSTHLVGKWHLGFYKKEFTPLQRGFDTHFGYWSGAISYYDHICENPFPTLNYSGHDMRRDYAPDYEVVGEYATDLFTREAIKVIENHNPERPMFMLLTHLAPHAGNQGKWLEAPQEEINKFSYISNPNRRSYAAMVSKLDQSVGEVVAALENQGMLKNSIIVFVSDNGAPNIGVYQNWGSNYPWRGQKATLWEAAVRTPSLVWSPLISRPSRVNTELMHISDWLPTLLAAAGHKGCTLNIDGINQWEAISSGHPSTREHLVIDIDDKANMAAMIFNDFKYVKGPIPPIYKPVAREVSMFLNTDTIKSPKQPKYDVNNITLTPVWKTLQKYSKRQFSPKFISELRKQATISCNLSFGKELDCTDQPCLFRIVEDPCEQHNVADHFPGAIELIEFNIDVYKKGAVTVPLVEDPASNPERFNGDWSIWVT